MNWWVTGGIYTQDVDEYCAKGYVCIPYEDTARTDDYIVVPGYRVRYNSVETVETTNPETNEVTTEFVTTLEAKRFLPLPENKFWNEVDLYAEDIKLVDNENNRYIDTWFSDVAMTALYDFEGTEVLDNLDVYGVWKTNSGNGGGGNGGGGSIVIPDDPTPLTPAPETEEILDDSVPLAPMPEPEVPLAPAPAPEMEELFDEEVPLAEAPKTGDASALWMILSALSGTGLAGVSLLGRKKRED